MGSSVKMTTLEKVDELLASMSPAEKAQVLEHLSKDVSAITPGIQKTPGVIGGDACIRRTRIAVWMLVKAKRIGATEADLLQNYPSLTAEDLVNAWTYYRKHPDEIDTAIAENDAV